MPQYGTILYFAVLVAVFYFLFIRPQMRRQKEQAALVASLAPGDRVITVGGIHGTIVSVASDSVDMEIAPGIVITVAKAAIVSKTEGV